MGFNLAEYEPVEDRLRAFWADWPEGRVLTDLVARTETQFVVKAFLHRNAEDATAYATGYAEETVSARGVNQTSALENCETSAIGRALANAGYAPKGKRPSREEMQKAERGQSVAKPTMSDGHLALKALLAKSHPDAADRKFYLEAIAGRTLKGVGDLTADEVVSITEQLTKQGETV